MSRYGTQLKDILATEDRQCKKSIPGWIAGILEFKVVFLLWELLQNNAINALRMVLERQSLLKSLLRIRNHLWVYNQSVLQLTRILSMQSSMGIQSIFATTTGIQSSASMVNPVSRESIFAAINKFSKVLPLSLGIRSHLQNTWFVSTVSRVPTMFSPKT